MKKWIIMMVSVLVLTHFVVASQSPELAEAQIVAAVTSQNPQEVMEALPVLRTLREVSPSVYFKTVKQVGKILDKENTPEATNAMKQLFADAFDTNVLTNSYRTTAKYLLAQHDTAIYLWVLPR